MATLVLLRHGSTVWGNENRFTGWGDTPLSEAGIQEARSAARLLRRQRPKFDVMFTSRLQRATHTAEIIAAELKLDRDAIVRDWRLNERHYGALQGESREAAIAQYGPEMVTKWRRSYHAQPPALEESDPRLAEQMARLPEIPAHLQPRTESMAEGAMRALPVWNDVIAPALRSGRNVLVVAHTSPIRAIVSAVEKLPDETSEGLRFATAIPKRYRFDANFNAAEGKYLVRGVRERLRLRSKQKAG